MTPEQFKQIKSDFNQIIETINHTKINGRDFLSSKFKKYDKHIKNEISIPKVKTFGEELNYSTSQILANEEFSYESFDYTRHKLEFKIYANFEMDAYEFSAKVSMSQNKYSPAFKIDDVDVDLYNNSFTSGDLKDFLTKFNRIYEDLTNIEARLMSGKVKLFSSAEDVATIGELSHNIIKKLEE